MSFSKAHSLVKLGCFTESQENAPIQIMLLNRQISCALHNADSIFQREGHQFLFCFLSPSPRWKKENIFSYPENVLKKIN